MAARITASCHSNGMASARTHSRQYAAVSSRKRLPTSATAPCTVSSGPSSRVMASSRKKGFSSTIAVTEARREVRDLDASAAAVVQTGDEDGRVEQVFLLLRRDIDQLHGEKTKVLVAGALAQQGAKHRIAVEARKAGPDDLARRVHQGADRPVADQAEIQGRHGVVSTGWPLPRLGVAMTRANQARTARTSRRRQRATVRPGPTLTEWPCKRLTVAKPCSSVMSSPTNTGVRPRNGSSCMNSSTATPLSLPAGFISTTRLPVWTQYCVPSPARSERTSRWA